MVKKPTTPGFIFFMLILHLIAVPARPAAGIEPVPFDTFNQSPVIQIFGLPATGSATVVPAGTIAAGVTFDAANNFSEDARGNESMILDGEQYRTGFSFRYGVGNLAEVGIEVPVLTVWGGVLNGPIQWWHKTFGFDQAGRDEVEEDRVLFTYSRDGRQRFRIDRSTTGIGDIRLAGGYQLYRQNTEKRALALRASLKLPTGSSSDLHGSGGTDFALWASGRETLSFLTDTLTLLYGAGGMAIGKGDLIPELQRDFAGFGTLGLAWSPYERWALQAQVNGNTPFYRNTELEQLSTTSLQIAIGGRVAFTGSTSFDICFSEDLLTVGSSPDFGITLSLKTLF